MNPILLTKIALWTITVIASTWMLKENKVNRKNRLMFLIAGTLVFGFIYGQLSQLNPNPMSMVSNLILNIKGNPVQVPLQLSIVMLAVMIVFVVSSNRSICGWGCQLGLLQDAIYHVPTKKVNVEKSVTLWTRVLFLVGFVGLLFLKGVNMLGILNPFGVFQLNLTLVSGVFFLGIVVTSIFFYRPWCRFLCPFGLVGLLAEQFSVYRPRINEETCVNCMQCVKACPTGAMKDFYEKNKHHNDCYACGACLEACKVDAIKWSNKKPDPKL